MPEDLWFEVVRDWLEQAGILQYHPPVLASEDTVLRPFGPYLASDSGPDWHFRTSLRLETTNPASSQLFAMLQGSLFFHPSPNPAVGKLILRRADMAGLALTGTIGMLPSWFPRPFYTIYENVDADSARLAILYALSDNRAKPVVARLQELNPQFTPANGPMLSAQLADLWMSNELPDGVFVMAGEQIGGPGPGTVEGSFFTEIQMVETIDPPATLFYNPSYFIALWEEMGWIENDNLLPGLTDTSGPPAGNGVLKIVSSNNLFPISQAVADADPGDTILIPTNLTYYDEIIIDKPINLVGASAASATSPSPDYPVLDGEGARRPITIRTVNSGIAHVGKLIIQNGWATGDRRDGGGILVELANNVVISSCVVRECDASGDGYFGEGFGGGIAAYHSSPAILGCSIYHNRANSRGKGIGIFGYGWPTIVDTEVRENLSADFGESNPRHDGGGIGIQICVTEQESMLALANQIYNNLPLNLAFYQPRLKLGRENFVRVARCKIIGNSAWDDGGGIYLTCASKLIIRSTKIWLNEALANGGGVRTTFGSDAIIRDCEIVGNHSQADGLALNEDGDEKRAGGGGIAARNANLLDIVRTLIADNVANGWAGGGVSFVSTDEGALFGGWVGWFGGQIAQFDWNNFLWDKLIYDHDHALLRIDAASSFHLNRATRFSDQITDHGKGGGLYALRWVGERQSGLDPVGDFVDGAGKMIAWWVHIYVFRAGSLEPSNEASFEETTALGTRHSKRMLIEDMVRSETHMDEDITKEILMISL